MLRKASQSAAHDAAAEETGIDPQTKQLPRAPGTRKRWWAAEPGKRICALGPGGSGTDGHVHRQEGLWEPGEGATVLQTQLVCDTLGSSPGSATYYDGTQDTNPQ